MRPFVREENDGLVELVGAEADAAGDDEAGGVALEASGLRTRSSAGPSTASASRRDSAPYSLCRRHCTTSNCSGPTAASRVAPDGAFLAVKDWTTPSCRSCSRPARYFFASPVFGIGDVGEDLGREARDLVVDDACGPGERVADAEVVVADEADDVARPGLVHGLALLAEELVRRGEADVLAGALVGDDHVALELAGADAQERDAVAVLRVHVGLNLEDEAGELLRLHGDDAVARMEAASSPPLERGEGAASPTPSYE